MMTIMMTVVPSVNFVVMATLVDLLVEIVIIRKSVQVPSQNVPLINFGPMGKKFLFSFSFVDSTHQVLHY